MFNIKVKDTYHGSTIIYPLFEKRLSIPKHQENLDALVKNDLFKGEKGSVYKVSLNCKDELNHLIFVGLGPYSDNYMEALRLAIGSGFKEAKSTKKQTVGIYLEEKLQCKECISNVASSLIMADYSFDKYLSKKAKNTVDEVILFGNNLIHFDVSVDEGIVLGEMTNLSRTLGNEPGDVINPETLSAEAVSLGEKSGFKVEVFEEDKIKELKMEAFLAVSHGSSYKPKLIVMEYFGDEDGPVLGLVGKGITFDSGGLSLKPSNSMLTMQGDMSGAGSVIAAMGAIAKLKLKVNVIGVIAACDNSVSAASYRPNDIIRSRSGKTIFIGNTDAEGRLTLIDALDYIITEKKVDKVIDIATLTGAAEIALGQKIAAVITNNDKFLSEITDASKKTGERVWELPHDEDFLKSIESPYADLTNSGGRYGGTITAGLFLGSVTSSLPWIHIDIAGPSWTEEASGYFSKGATGFGTRLLYQIAKDFNKDAVKEDEDTDENKN